MRVLYVSHTGMTEPLGHSQVIPYVEGLARAGFLMEIMAFEPERGHPRRVVRTARRLAGDQACPLRKGTTAA